MKTKPKTYNQSKYFSSIEKVFSRDTPFLLEMLKIWMTFTAVWLLPEGLGLRTLLTLKVENLLFALQAHENQQCP
jgi:hypothetical protein